jgi:hypothetical protein
MIIRMKKNPDGVVLICLRDGHEPQIQRTGHGGFFALHDLLHYSVETVLGFDQAFFGLLASGWSFENFTRHDDPRYRQPPPQSLVAEHLVGILSLHFPDAASRDQELLELVTEDINRDLAASMAKCGIPAPVLSVADVTAIRRKFDELAARWRAMSVGQHLELSFPQTETPTTSR